MSIEIIRTSWAMVSPLMLHNSRLADPLNRYAMELKKLTSLTASKKTEATYREMGRIEWEGGLYIGQDGDTIVLPGQNIEACIRNAARLHKKGKDIERGVVVLDDSPILSEKGKAYKLSRISSRWEEFASRKVVGIGKNKIVRTRPLFRDWRIEAELRINPDIINPKEVFDYIEEASQLIGIGDYLPRFGRFNAKRIKR